MRANVKQRSFPSLDVALTNGIVCVFHSFVERYDPFVRGCYDYMIKFEALYSMHRCHTYSGPLAVFSGITLDLINIEPNRLDPFTQLLSEL